MTDKNTERSSTEIVLGLLESVDESRRAFQERAEETNRRAQKRYETELVEFESERGQARVWEHAREHGMSFRDAFRALQPKPPENVETGYPLSDAHVSLHATTSGLTYSDAAVQLTQRGFVWELADRHGAMAPAEEREAYGFSNEDVEARARSRNLSYREALDEVIAEHSEKEAVKRAAEDERRIQETYRQLEEES